MSTGERDELGPAGTALAIAAVVGIVVATVAVVAPGAVPLPPGIERLLTTVPPAVVLSLLAVATLLVLAVRSRRSRSSALDPLLVTEDTAPRAPVLGSGLDDDVAAATDLDATRERRLAARERVEERVGAAAIDAYTVAVGVDRETARTAVRTGEWTADRRASALVGGPDAPTPSRGRWLLDLLRSESAYGRRVRHAVAEIERLVDRDRARGGGSSAPAADGSTSDGSPPSAAADADDGRGNGGGQA